MTTIKEHFIRQDTTTAFNQFFSPPNKSVVKDEQQAWCLHLWSDLPFSSWTCSSFHRCSRCSSPPKEDRGRVSPYSSCVQQQQWHCEHFWRSLAHVCQYVMSDIRWKAVYQNTNTSCDHKQGYADTCPYDCTCACGVPKLIKARKTDHQVQKWIC